MLGNIISSYVEQIIYTEFPALHSLLFNFHNVVLHTYLVMHVFHLHQTYVY